MNKKTRVTLIVMLGWMCLGTAVNCGENKPASGATIYQENFNEIPMADDLPAAWRLYCPQGTEAKAAIVNEDCVSKPYSLKYTIVSGEKASAIMNPIKFNMNKNYAIHFKAKSDSPSSRMSINGAGIHRALPIGKTDGWQDFTLALNNPAPDRDTGVSMNFVVEGNQKTLWLDDLAIEEFESNEQEIFSARLKHPALNRISLLKSEPGDPVGLVKDGKPEASIFVDIPAFAHAGKTNQAEILKLAAEDLQFYIEQSTGAKLPIVEQLPAQENVIIIGDCEAARKLGIDTGKMDKDSFIVKTFPGKIVIAGKGPETKETFLNSPTYWGACDFLERFVGVRWYYPGELGTVIPSVKNLHVFPVCYKDAPQFQKRIIYRFHGNISYPGKQLPQYSGVQTYGHFRIGDSSEMPTPCHTPGNWAEVYGKSHPEYFQMGADGVRRPPMWCYSQPAVLKQFIADLEKYYQTDMQWHDPWGKDWQRPTKTAIPVSPLDAPVTCYCPECRKLIKKDSQMGFASQVLGNFLNKLSLEVKQKWPDKTVVFLPYMNYTEAPENIEFPDNFAVSLCWMRTVANLKEPQIMEEQFKIRNDWKKITRQPMAHWLYTCWPDDCTKAPYQYPHVMKTFFTKTKGDTGFFCDAGVNWARKHLTHYLMARLMWNPDFDVDAALDEYYRLMYGNAAGTMGQLYTVLIDGWEQSRWKPPLPTYHQISLYNVHAESYPLPTVKKLQALIDKALEEVAENSTEHQRIAYVKTALDPFFEESAMFHKGGAKKELQVLRISAMPLLDGKLDEDFWRQAPEAKFVTLSKESPEPGCPTTVKGVWIPDQGVVFGFKMTEPDLPGMRATREKHDESVYMDDSVEIFLDPMASQQQFFQIAVNSKGTLFDSLYHNPGAAWNSKGIISKSFMENNTWTMEIFIPFATLQAKNVKTGTAWFVNFTRSRWREKDKGGNELSRFSTSYDLGKLNSNLNPLNFGQIKFIE